jgi:hypothetical protein
MVAYQ